MAGKRKGLQGERSGLFSQIIAIAHAIKPTWGLFENVPGLFSSNAGRDMATVLEGLRECWPVVGYRVLDSRYFHLAQRRERVFFACGPTERSVEEVLFESDGSGRDLTTGGETGAHVAASLRIRSSNPGTNPPGRGGEDDMNVVCAPLNHSPYGDQQGDESKLVVAATLKQRMRGCTDEVMDTLQVVQALTNLGSGGPDDNEAQGDAQTKRIHSADGVAPTLATSDGKGGQRTTNVQSAMGVRRLTPTETERLQGFLDGWTCLCQPLESYDSNRCTCPDGHRYKAMGNAVSVPVIEWIGKRLKQQERSL